MPVNIRLGASLKLLLGSKGEFSVEGGRSMREILTSLDIKPELVAMVLVNGEVQSKDYIVQDGDKVRLMAVIGGG
jgi:sulfur carrier protein ThiS